MIVKDSRMVLTMMIATNTLEVAVGNYSHWLELESLHKLRYHVHV